jgi:hypothetical protein
MLTNAHLDPYLTTLKGRGLLALEARSSGSSVAAPTHRLCAARFHMNSQLSAKASEHCGE